jgi:hypothetical protein
LQFKEAVNYKNGDIYRGYVNKDGKIEGVGIYTKQDKYKQVGEWCED